ncbi:MAG: 2,3-bisphosphoglycerate-independent phosphoglycerate mutase [Candidatus Krumholzibacteriia bacterium]
MKRRIVLLIMDGWGLRADGQANAVAQAATPIVDGLWNRYPHTTLDPSGTEVGLPAGQMGNSEVGHLNLGAGRVVYQDIMRISRAIESGEFFENGALTGACDAVGDRGTLHLMGLLSTGGVHSTREHLYALLEMARRRGVRDVCVHAFLDGRDTSPTAGTRYLSDLQDELDAARLGRVATVCGRYYCMDRDKRWDRVQKGYDALTAGRGRRVTDYQGALRESYDRDVTDEFVEPIVVTDGKGKPVGTVRDGDSIIFFNFRADRARQLTAAFTEAGFTGFTREARPEVDFVCMTAYDKRFKLPVAFPRAGMKNILGAVAAAAGRTGFRLAETEKYAHVTYFFNGGVEEPFEGEDRILVPSPSVATYDLQPAMSALGVTEALIQTLGENRHDYVVCNFANPDMVGHTGVLEAAIEAVETVDTCVGRVIEALDPGRDAAIVTADHGNAELMIDPETGGPHTAHTTNPVPCILVDERYDGNLIEGGSLKEIAPTMCHYMGVDVPPEITGRDLREDC